MRSRWSKKNGRKSARRTAARRFLPLRAEALEPRTLLTAVPQLLADINTQPAGVPVISPIWEANGLAYFARDGATLWKSDGTTAGTMPAVKFAHGNGSNTPISFFTNVNGQFFFNYNDGTNGSELWKSDGTTAGTHLVKDILPGANGSNPYFLTNVAGTLFFAANDGTHGTELWKSDGTSAGTVMVDDIDAGAPGSLPTNLTAVGNLLYFSANDVVIGGSFWRTDGTAAGTIEIAAKAWIRAPFGPTPPDFAEMNGEVYFPGNFGTQGVELWKTDGTVVGTSLVADIRPGSGSSSPMSLVNVNGTLFFQANDGLHPGGLWKSDGTQAGTTFVKDVFDGNSFATTKFVATVNDKPIFFIADDTGTRAWSSDGTDSGTVPISPPDVNAGIGSPSPFPSIVNNVLYFGAKDKETGEELWRTDGTVAGTFLVKDIMGGVGTSYPDHLSNINGKLFFYAAGSSTGLWTSDGTSAGTVPVPAAAPADSSGVIDYAAQAAVVGDQLFFVGSDGATGNELWKTDGTLAGTRMVKDIVPGATGSTPNYLVNANGMLFFGAKDYDSGYRDLWRSDGTDQGTVPVTDKDGALQSVAFEPVIAGNDLFYISVLDPSLRKVGPTADSATVVMPFDVGVIANLTEVNSTLYFLRSTMTADELWISDGTNQGTVKLMTFPAGSDAVLQSFVNVNGILYFAENSDTSGVELWRSDGTPEGTKQVKDINVGPTGGEPQNLANVDGTLYFSANDGTHGSELWKSDGTEAGTVLIKDINSGGSGSNPSYFTSVNGKVLFAANDGVTGIELWRSDGTESGTTLFKDIRVGKSGSFPVDFRQQQGIVYFNAATNVHGRELWRTDGSAAGTFQLPDINPGSGSSSPRQVFLANNHLLFAANDGTHGRELWTTVDINAAPSFTMQPESFAVTDEQPRVFGARTVSFFDLNGDPGNGDLFSGDSEGGFNVAPTAGPWKIAMTAGADPALLGNPTPAIWEDASAAALDVTRDGGGSFTFTSLDLSGGGVTYTLTGKLGGKTVYSTVSTLPLAGANGLVTIASPSSAAIDDLQIAIARTSGGACSLDNIQLTTPVASVTVPEWVTNVTAGPPDESSQVLTLTVTSDKPSLFLDQPAVDHNGMLTFTPAPNASGTATVTVTLHDDGGTANGGVDTTVKTFQIAIAKPHPGHNTANANDVSGDGHVAPVDALAVINYLNAFGPGPVSSNAAGSPPFLDVTGDNNIAPIDALAIINVLNAGGSAAAASFPGAATFVGIDMTTQGNWQTKYGAEGYAIDLGPTSLPPQTSVAFTGALTDVYDGFDAASSTSVNALQLPGSSDRIAAALAGDFGFTLDLNLGDGQPHQVALYVGTASRDERLDVVDAATGNLLDSESVETFADGKYLVWTLSGHVQIRFTNLSNGSNAVVSGIFFGGAAVPGGGEGEAVSASASSPLPNSELVDLLASDIAAQGKRRG